MPEKKDFNPIPHPIQLISINIEELFIRTNKSYKPTEPSTEFGEAGEFNLRTGKSKYDEEKHIIQVGIILEVGGKEKKETPFDMKIVISGVFMVDETKFEKAHIDDWAKRNAPIILYPYLREQAYALSIRCGFTGILLPLLTVPTFKIEPPEKEGKAKIKFK
jgi:preprotein translocase subunit SecB